MGRKQTAVAAQPQTARVHLRPIRTALNANPHESLPFGLRCFSITPKIYSAKEPFQASKPAGNRSLFSGSH